MRLSKKFLLCASALVALSLLPLLTGCSRFRPHAKADIVYVMVKQTFLRDRVAAVSNRIAPVVNGQRLEVIERGRRFLKVKTEKNEIGWIEDRAVIDATVYQGFEDLDKAHQKDPVIATAVLRDDLYVHLTPGRDTERFYLLPEGEKLQLLVRASVPKPQSAWGALPRPIATPSKTAKPGATPPPAPAAPKTSAKPDVAAAKPPTTPAATAPPTPASTEPVPLEDWWLVRSSKGRVGWLLARRMDVDVPEAVAGYAEGQKMVGAYVLATVTDSEATTPDKQVPEYVTVLNAYKDGLPYDFDQVRVFTWNLKKHRYETAYRQRNLQGYLPVQVSNKSFDGGPPVPSFSFRQAVGDQVAIDSTTGVAKPAQMETLTFRMDGVIVKRVATPAEIAATRAAAKSVASVKAADKKSRHGKNRHAAK
jgi:hypothetical protein